MKILIMGLAGSGKTTLAKRLTEKLDADYFNADEVRKLFNDWEFSPKARDRQAERMAKLADIADRYYVIADFICPTKKTRELYSPDYVVWMNTITESNSANGPAAPGSTFKQTDKMFEPPEKVDIIVTEKDVDKWVEIVYNDIIETFPRF